MKARWLGGAAILFATIPCNSALAQSIEVQTSALHDLPREYQPLGIRAGTLLLYPELFAGLEYDDNIFAEPDNTNSDEIIHILPRLRTEMNHGAWKFSGLAQAHVRRFSEHHSENSTAATVEGEVKFSPHAKETFGLVASWNRTVEDRGDPEAKPGALAGPRIANVFDGELSYHRNRGVWLVDASAAATKYDYVAATDVFRDYLATSGQLTVGRAISGITTATITGFIQHRKFDRKIDLSGLNRDATTYGVRAGVDFSPGGLIEGSAQIGVFRFDPADATIDSYTGVSVSADLIWRPTERTAVLLGAFSGNVATFQAGAKSRTDTRLRLSVQQEVHHDVFLNISGSFRDTKFRGSGINEKTYVVEASAQYVISRHFSVAAIGRYSTRNSDNPFDDFDRTRLLVELRAVY